VATIDWPSTRAFASAQFSLALDTSESGYAGFLTGNRQRRSNLADRLRCITTLPPVANRSEAAQRTALLLGLRSTGDLVRFGLPHQQLPLGTLRGSPVVAANVLAGARSMTVSGALAAPNLLLGGSFEVDTNGDGVADNWLAYNSGSVSGITYGRPAGINSTYAQRITAATLGSGSGDQAGVGRAAFVPVVAGASYSMSCDAISNYSTLQVRLHVDWYTSADVLLSGSGVNFAGPLSWQRLAANGLVAPATAAKAKAYVWMQAHASGGASPQIFVDNFQLEPSIVATAYAGTPTLGPADMLAVGGNLLAVAYPGATLDDAGAGTVPLLMPAMAAMTAGGAVTWNAPAGLWELDDDGLQLDYSPPVVQAGLAVPWRQVPA
jgi:hypothetical protein